MRNLLSLLFLLLPVGAVLAADPARLAVYVFDGDRPVEGVALRASGTELGRTSTDGALHRTIAPGEHRIQLLRGEDELATLPLSLQEGEDAQLIVVLRAGAAPRLLLESSHRAPRTLEAAAPAGPPGRLAGRIVSAEDGRAVAGARVYVAGIPLDLRTDAEGRFEVELAAGSHAISILAPGFSSQTIEAVEVPAGEEKRIAIELTPAGVEMPEFVVIQPFVEGSLAAFAEERRTSSAVADLLGAEQISRAGDSDAAGALKRVTGLTLVDGRFVYVRGLGERYASVLLNGAQVPSPDPTRRVVPLDLFPADILQGIVVQKTFSADLPGEFGGGTIQLRTRGIPEGFVLKAGLGLGHAAGTTGEQGLGYAGGNRDWTGFDDGSRAAPPGLLGPALPSDPAALEALGEELAGRGFGVRRRTLGPGSSGSFALGDVFEAEAGWSLGYLASLRHSQSWDHRTEQRAAFSVLGNGQLIPLTRFERQRTERSIDAGAFLATGLKLGEDHEISATAFEVRQTVDETRIDEGVLGSGNLERQFLLQWTENELFATQLGGHHALRGEDGPRIAWQITDSRARRQAPFAREYGFSYDEGFDAFFYNGQNLIRYENLVDDARQWRLDLEWPWRMGETATLTLQAGLDRLDRSRRSSIDRFAYRGGRVRDATSIDEVLQPGLIGPDPRQLRLQRSTQPTDAYTAGQRLDARYLGADLRLDRWRFVLGLREEHNDQEVRTRPLFAGPEVAPVVGRVQATDRLPSAAITRSLGENAQLRLGLARTVSRPDFRELSEAPFIDPQLDIRVQGNPELLPAAIRHLDLRWEYYFSATESLSLAWFRKDFDHPIELVRVPASGELLGIRNAEAARNRGIEIDLYASMGKLGKLPWLPRWMQGLPWDQFWLGGNYARIDSEIDLGSSRGTQTSARRPLQGQSPYVGNLSLSWLHPQGDFEATLLYNVFGPRIAQVGDSGVPDVYEQPFGQLDFTFTRRLAPGWSMKLRLRNLLDPEQRYQVGDAITRRFHKGREVQLALEWRR